MIDRESPVSLYYQIATDLRSRIARGEWTEEMRLPGEIDLAGEYQVSRMTLRQALAYLENEGILIRKRGVGTLIRIDPKRVGTPLNFPISFSRQMRELGFSPTVKAVHAKIISDPTPDIMTNLNLAESDQVASFKRLFFVNEHPVAIINSMLPHHLCPDIINNKLYHDSLTATLEKTYGLFPVQVDQRLSATLLSSEDADLLKANPGSAIFEITTRSHLEDGRIIEFAKTLCVGDRLSLHINISSLDESGKTKFEYVATI
ncbi:MAG: GntR family transcriptional regulator [Anaerolineales bacterium]|uniref:GntR family transcriptional regulator n=1 Tax=Candidatus Desulfolinea nitratireducens TaxID=2841698 RepID=A0A8J6NM01_9CHLR|nr:GntR family transcriptional regulator [Candidatus Desulfolinea nitratireducens]